MMVVFQSVVTASLWGAGLTAVVWLLNKLFLKRLPMSWHYYVWVVVLVRLLLPVFFTVNVEMNAPGVAARFFGQPTIPERTAVLKHSSATPEVVVSELIRAENIGLSEIFSSGVTVRTIPYIAAPPDKLSETPSPLSQAMTALLAIWVAVALLSFAYKCGAQIFYMKKLKAIMLIPSETEYSIYEELKAKHGINKCVMLAKSICEVTPFTAGLFKPVIVLPDKKYTDAQLKHILNHELIHIKRRDIAVKWLFEIAKSVHWFNPAVYVAAKASAFYCEASCDAAVLRNADESEKKSYGLTVIDVVSRAVAPKTTMCVSMNSDKSALKRRIDCILTCGYTKKRIGLYMVATLLALSLCACTGLRLKSVPVQTPEPTPESIAKSSPEPSPAPTSASLGQKPKSKLNILVTGMDGADEKSRTDTIMLAALDSDANTITVMSIPRDTMLEPQEEIAPKLVASDVSPPKSLKFGELAAYSGGDTTYLKAEVERLLGISIDYNIKIKMPEFERIVDAVGGVEMTIPDGGLHYKDNAQNLEISLKGGKQLLDGKKALQLVRYRATYPNGDLGRVEVQQQFVKALYYKMMDSSNFVTRLPDIAATLIEGVETDITLDDVIRYGTFFTKMSKAELKFITLPTETKQLDYRFYAVPIKTELENIRAAFE